MSDIDKLVEERGGLYGHPYDNFANIAMLWEEYLIAKNRNVMVKVDRFDVAMMLVLFKVARTINDKTVRDNLDDIAGYAKCAHMILDKMEKDNV